MRWTARELLFPTLLGIALSGCGREERAPETPAAGTIPPQYLALFQPLPDSFQTPDNPMTPEKVALGRMLFYDARISAGQTISCYVCHPLHEYGTTHRDRAVGHEHQEGPLNEPTVYNAAGQIAQFWDGRAANVEDQAKGPPLNPLEMAIPDSQGVVTVLRSIPGYVEAFRLAFPGEADPITFTNFGKAVGAFERGLTTPAPWDRYLKGDQGALTQEQLAGFLTFVEVGCAGCHNGPLVGGNQFRKMGEVKPWPDSSDLGRFDVTGREEDKLVFKVPMLRNVTETWPYFHKGNTQRLDDAVRIMAEYQLGTSLTDAQVDAILRWLETLEGEIPRDYIEEPRLPPGPETPIPDRR